MPCFAPRFCSLVVLAFACGAAGCGEGIGRAHGAEGDSPAKSAAQTTPAAKTGNAPRTQAPPRRLQRRNPAAVQQARQRALRARNGNASSPAATPRATSERPGAARSASSATPRTAIAPRPAPNAPSPIKTAAEVDRIINGELKKSGVATSERIRDEDFCRRVTFDLAGIAPSPSEVTLFALDPDPAKREKLVDRLLESQNYAENWSRYWRDVIFLRATDMRAPIARQTFETWMTDQLQKNRAWDLIASDLVTATGDVREKGETALIFAHGGQPSEIASEVSRVFLGIQIQCANCHDHPSDKWKRNQFHELAAFFPRVQLRPKLGDGMRSFEVASLVGNGPGRGRGPEFLKNNAAQIVRRLDRNNDGKLSREEVRGSALERPFALLLAQADTNKDGMISADEIRKAPPPPEMPGRGSAEYFMPDLANPASPGKLVEPVFFVDGARLKSGADDLSRRESLARSLTSSKNPWFARAVINRLWGEMVGQGFYTPVDDLGPQRKGHYLPALDALADGFIASGYDLKWLYRTIAATEVYQRTIRPADPSGTAPPFAAATPTRLRADQVYSSLTQALGIRDVGATARGRQGPAGRFGDRSPRGQFNVLFGFDPSTPQQEITGNVPQALFLMNSRMIDNLIRADGNNRLAQILRDRASNEEALSELYLHILAREPSAKERKTCLDYISRVGNRKEAFEDVMWSLINSSEFLSKR